MSNASDCLSLIVAHYCKQPYMGRLFAADELQSPATDLLSISRVAERAGFRTKQAALTCAQLSGEITLPCIIYLPHSKRFGVVHSAKSGIGRSKIKISIPPDPGAVSINKDLFGKSWINDKNERGMLTGSALIIEPTFRFYALMAGEKPKLSWKMVFAYFKNSHWQLISIIAAFLIASLVQLIFPFLLQSIVDVGIGTKDIHYITVILFAQLMLVFSRISVDFVRARLLWHISNLINLSILSDFWIKLFRLPMSFFDQQPTGNIMQRINDNRQIQTFLTGSAVNTFFSLLNFIVFAVVLMMLKGSLFGIFAAGVFIYFLWIRFFLKYRRKLNNQIFKTAARENNATLEIVQGMQEIKLQNIEQSKRWEWEKIQIALFRLNIKNLTLGQIQQSGAILINQSKDIFLTFAVAKLVISGDLTFGSMLAVQYIIGQLTGPIELFIGFLQAAQDAKISMERLNEIHLMDDEEKDDQAYKSNAITTGSIKIRHLSFGYPGTTAAVINGIDLDIPEGKTTAIVGVSGSGKTTLLRLLLKFYESYEGTINIGEEPLGTVNPSAWRKQCGAVLQDGFIFNDTIANNIALGCNIIDQGRLQAACNMANILSFVQSLPGGFDTMIGSLGVGISQGQKQRILIARVIYKNSPYIFFDESTNALDANNEKTIVENLQPFFVGKTVVVVAHRLSTVKNADKIVVLHNGRIIEQGSHHQLAGLKGRYFELVRNQLELGN